MVLIETGSQEKGSCFFAPIFSMSEGKNAYWNTLKLSVLNSLLKKQHILPEIIEVFTTYTTIIFFLRA